MDVSTQTMDLTLFDNKYLFGTASGVGGMLLGLLVNWILNKRALFTYFVNHYRVGVSTADAVFGSVQVTWNGNVMPNLYLSTIELMNQSMKDFENVVVRAYTNDTTLLTERTEIVGTTHILNWTNEYSNQLRVNPGQQPSPTQVQLYSSRRDYLIPTMNRYQVIRLHFLNSANTQNQPSIWLDVVHRGVKLKFRIPQNQFLGVPQQTAALIGGALGLVFIVFIISVVQNLWMAAFLSFLFGYLALLPGAYCVKLWRWLRELLGG